MRGVAAGAIFSPSGSLAARVVRRASAADPGANMTSFSLIVLGGTGLIGSAVCERFTRDGPAVISVDSKNYACCVGTEADVLINCNGNSYRYRAGQDPRWDFDASVLTVEKSLFDFKFGRYIHVSTIDVYNELGDPARNQEDTPIEPERLHPYGFHKWLAERLVQRFAAQPLILRVGTVVGTGMKKGPLLDLLLDHPLPMSAESELSLIDTATIAEAVVRFVATTSAHRTINLTGTGPALLRALCADAGLKWRLAPGAEQVVYRYNINNARLRELFPVPTSYEMGSRFLANASVKEL
jgi:nucleoside-diphosphate-sugar epimerase